LAWSAVAFFVPEIAANPRYTPEIEFRLIAFDTVLATDARRGASPYVDTVTGSAVNVSYKAAYRGVRATDIGGSSAEQTIAAGS
jgi:hypothetical protein